MLEYIAHRRESDGATQPLAEHLLSVAELAGEFAASFHGSAYAYQIGLGHDLGKSSPEAQARMRGERGPVDHSTAGAQAANPLLGAAAAYCVAGHHAGLPNGGTVADTADDSTLAARLHRPVPDCSRLGIVPLEKTPLPAVPLLGQKGFSFAFLTRMLFSCLVDADFLDTERFMKPERSGRGMGEPMDVLLQRMERHVEDLLKKESASELNRLRSGILRLCRKKGDALPRGLYTLTVPTGGGKTDSSLAFALHHAAAQGMRRVLYAVPFTTITEQTANKFREILGDENVLEHHSNLSFQDGPQDEPNPHRLAAENWDAPVVVTTNVQFFESLFANRPGRCRKLHNIAGSVILLDEAQSLPVPYLLPCLRALAELVRNYGCTVVLCTATQPALQRLFPCGVTAQELAENLPELFQRFRRTRFVREGALTDEALIQRLREEPQVLCIVNTRRHAQALFQGLQGAEGLFHLSTLMYPEHRRRALETIRERLKAGLPCRVISTTLIEAGVDVDFASVYRAESGLDSMIQAAGRCNRENKKPLESSIVHLFAPDEQYTGHLPSSMKRPLEVAKNILQKYEDIASPEAVHAYFQQLYFLTGDGLDQKRIVDRLEKSGVCVPFADIAQDFQLIEQDTDTILIPLDEKAEPLAQELREQGPNRVLLRKIVPYSVSVYHDHLKRLAGAGSLQAVADGLYLLADLSLYDQDTGLKLDVEGGIGHFH
ncbi:CRISPR-associated helicase Cas3' [Ligaoa zhengdingensis]|uniref:CRISPR-associated helicase Cas3' n=2 Tax=Ligaoa zhengdingensis TaxID=2763658 RepID=UPI0031BBCA76